MEMKDELIKISDRKDEDKNDEYTRRMKIQGRKDEYSGNNRQKDEY